MLTALLALSSMSLIGSRKLLLRRWSQYPVSRAAIDENADDIAAEWAALSRMFGDEWPDRGTE
jgi:hypothetical protein